MRSFLFKVVFATILFCPGVIHGQNVPPFNITYYDSSSTGYYFTLPFRTGIIPGNIYQNQMILDSTGRIVYYKSFPDGSGTSDFKLQPNGWVTYSHAGQHFIMDSTFTIIDTLICANGIGTDVHDLQILPNGHYLLLGLEEVVVNLSSYYYFGPNNNAPGGTNAHLRYAVIQELDTAKNVVFEWHAYNYFSFLDVDTNLLNGPNFVDWTHSNSIAVDYDGNLLLSSRNFNEITKINRQNGNVIWRLGGNANQFTFLNDTMQFKRQHDARRLSNGNLTLYDNGNGMTSNGFHFASAKEYHIDETAMTAELVWSYIDDSSEYSNAMGNFQRKPGEISIVDYGINDTQNKVFSAVNDAGFKVFQMEFVFPLYSYRSFNYKTLPWELNRPQVFCFENNGQLYLDAGAVYSSYLWSNGDTTKIIQVSVSDTFFVYVPYGDGGYLSSVPLFIDNPLTYCDPTSDNISQDKNDVYIVNPVVEDIEIYFENENYIDKRIWIYDVSGKMLFNTIISNQTKTKIPCGYLKGGIYFVKIDNEVFKITKF